MSEHNIHNTEEHAHDEHAGLSKAKIWQVFFILLGITVVEFVIALVIQPYVKPYPVAGSLMR